MHTAPPKKSCLLCPCVTWHLCSLSAFYATQKALESDDEEFYGYDLSETSDVDDYPCENFSEEDDEHNDPHSFESTLELRVKDVTSGKVSRTKEGSALGVLVPAHDPLYEHIGRRLSENCCDSSCLSAFNTDEIYQFHLNLLEMKRTCCC